MRKLLLAEFVVLLGGTIFAWYNFALEFVNWTNGKVCTTGCSVDLTNPFLSKCFFGAVFFTIALILSMIMLKKKTD